LVEKSFDIVDLMFREMEKAQSDKRRLIPYAPYIMLQIDRATKGKYFNGFYKIVHVDTIFFMLVRESTSVGLIGFLVSMLVEAVVGPTLDDIADIKLDEVNDLIGLQQS
jgi:hypothetical protein